MQAIGLIKGFRNRNQLGEKIAKGFKPGRTGQFDFKGDLDLAPAFFEPQNRAGQGQAKMGVRHDALATRASMGTEDRP